VKRAALAADWFPWDRVAYDHDYLERTWQSIQDFIYSLPIPDGIEDDM
jgi:hypothetical protein